MLLAGVRSFMGLSSSALQKLRTASDSSEEFEFIVACLEKHSGLVPETNGFEFLAEKVDRSPYGLSEWIKALHLLQNWLQERGRTADLMVMLGFLECCVLYVRGNPILPNFPELVGEMLDEFGFEGGLSR